MGLQGGCVGSFLGLVVGKVGLNRVEGEERVFATLGDDKCTVDSLTQRRVETLGTDRAVYRVEARGFCLGPATSLSRGERVVVTSFDFAGRVEFMDDDRHAQKPSTP